jgi:ATP-dependent Zn protease
MDVHAKLIGRRDLFPAGHDRQLIGAHLLPLPPGRGQHVLVTSGLRVLGAGAELSRDPHQIHVAVAALEDGKIKVVGNQAGTTMITVKSGNISKTFTVTVTKSAEEIQAENDKKENETKSGFVSTVNPVNYSGGTWLVLAVIVIVLGIGIFVFRRMRA